MRRLGDSVDWSRDAFTMDPERSAAVIEVFGRLHEEGLIYRGKRWSTGNPVLLSALSDLEVQSEPEEGQLWHLRYRWRTARATWWLQRPPETMFGDTARGREPR